MKDSEIKVVGTKKTIDVLNCFIDKQPLGVTDISEKLGLFKSNVHGILVTLAAMDYLEKDELSGKYYLGIGALRLYRAVGDRFNFRSIAIKYMQILADDVKEVIYLTVPMKNQIYYLETIHPLYMKSFMVAIHEGMEDMHNTSCGKAMMAYMPEDFLKQYFSQCVKQRTRNTITDMHQMERELQIIRRQGYAVDNEESRLGLRCVGVPIISRNLSVCGALSMSGPVEVFTDEYINRMAEKLKICSKQIEQAM